MLEITSTGCGKYHHAEFRLRLDTETAVERDARELVARLERAVAGGHVFKDGQVFSWGWLNLRFRHIADDLIAVEEPDLAGFPLHHIDSVTNSLRHLEWQRICASALGLDESLEPPAMTQTAAICPRLEKSDSFFMERYDAPPESSGWIIGCDEPGHDHVHSGEMIRASLYEVVLRFRIAVAAFLALPSGTKVLNNAQGLWISCDGRSHQIRPGSFLDELLNGPTERESSSILLDDSHNLLISPAGTAVAPYLIPLSRHLVVRCDLGSALVSPPEIQALGIQHPNTAVLLSKGVQWRKAWNGDCAVDFDLTQSESEHVASGSGATENGKPGGHTSPANLRPGDELILILGFSDPRPDSITKGGIAAMWSGRLTITAASPILP